MNILEAFKKFEQGEKIRPVAWENENYKGTEMYIYKNCLGSPMIQARKKEDCKAFEILKNDIETILLGDWEVFEMDEKEQLKLDGMKFQLSKFCKEQSIYSFGCQNLDNHGFSWGDCKFFKTICNPITFKNNRPPIKEGFENWDMLEIIEAYQELNKKEND